MVYQYQHPTFNSWVFNMQDMIGDIKYEIIEIESKIRSIDSTKDKMKEWVGKPIYETCKHKILKWQEEIEQHYKNIDYWYNELKK